MTDDRLRATVDLSAYLEADTKPYLPDIRCFHILPSDGTRTSYPLAVDPRDFPDLGRVEKAAGINSGLTGAITFAAVTWRTLRGIPWTLYPVLPEPAYKIAMGETATSMTWTSDRKGVPGISDPLSLVSSATAVFVHACNGGSGREEAARMARVMFLLRGVTCPVYEVKDGKVSLAGLGRLKAEAAKGAAHERFRYAYNANFAAIGGKALIAAIGPGEDADSAWFRDDIARHSHYLAENPLALQALYRLRDQGRSIECGRSDGETPVLFVEDKPADMSARAEWHGTGKHAPAIVGYREVHRVVTGLRPFVALDETHYGSSAIRYIQITQMGERLLDILGKDCRDTDLPCRWAKPQLDDADAKSMDDWIMRFFSKMKTAVNKLPRD